MNTITIENTDEMRRCEGIDDDELRAAIGRLRMGDKVRLTFLTGLSFQETLPARFTRIPGKSVPRSPGLPSGPPTPLPAPGRCTHHLYRSTDSLDRRYTLPSGSLPKGATRGLLWTAIIRSPAGPSPSIPVQDDHRHPLRFTGVVAGDLAV
jgi:hypothetical protein